MLKAAVVGGQSLVFKGYHAVGETISRPHRFSKPKPCRRVIGYDANTLYLSTLLHEMPCGKEAVVHYDAPAEAVSCFTELLKAGVLWVCGSGHRDPQMPVDEVQRNAAIFLYETGTR